MLRDFSWRVFASTGDIQAYLLYRDHHQTASPDEEDAFDFAQNELGESQACL
ncbi:MULTISPECIES: YqzL family protein [Brevibacillus]|uniref:YqzL family protein n=1 Tax=Brevibacillus invocatus TaxID=173959 RepID=A0A3M8CM38_9BACL|nr:MULTISPECIES: YqzL family protein [Brevibacillus]MCM3079165.1 YqzL family protein [Brevibacillus invocatus]MCM3429292.1 YqzL family protein [Brevibacillus invocatus]MDH4615671.1 YqzL family protein [Brevibacillus sp. AY1]RNB76826.1 YqzL family protein [Brevibacillus invocatus]